jgi:hypothetical protein
MAMRDWWHRIWNDNVDVTSLRFVVALALLGTAAIVWGIRWFGGEPALTPDVPEETPRPATIAVPVYRADGTYWGFIADDYLFDAAGAYVGWVEGSRVWHRSGAFMGELVDGTYILRNTTTTAPMAFMPRMPPASPLPPLPPRMPMTRMASLVGMGWVDALGAQ